MFAPGDYDTAQWAQDHDQYPVIEYEQTGTKGQWAIASGQSAPDLRDDVSDEYESRMMTKLEANKVEVDFALQLFIRVMRYIWIFIPDVTPQYTFDHVTFQAKVCDTREHLRAVCNSATWTCSSVYSEHPGVQDDCEERSVVVIEGTVDFFDILARHTWPLGQLGHKRSFWDRPENLQIFIRALN